MFVLFFEQMDYFHIFTVHDAVIQHIHSTYLLLNQAIRCPSFHLSSVLGACQLISLCSLCIIAHVIVVYSSPTELWNSMNYFIPHCFGSIFHLSLIPSLHLPVWTNYHSNFNSTFFLTSTYERTYAICFTLAAWLILLNKMMSNVVLLSMMIDHFAGSARISFLFIVEKFLYFIHVSIDGYLVYPILWIL